MALVAGALNAVAGGGAFLMLPALLRAGVSPVASNATTTFATWPGSVASTWAYRREITAPRRALLWLGAASLAGGLLGGLLLVRTSDDKFLQLLPWLMLAAALTFTFGGWVTSLLRRRQTGGSVVPVRHDVPPWTVVLQFLVATYGGYFGGGMGFMMLAILTVAGMTDIHEMNGLKTLLAVAINGVALVEFIANGAIVWFPGVYMVFGAVLGGYVGAAAARRVNPKFVRNLVIVIGWVMTIYFFLR